MKPTEGAVSPVVVVSFALAQYYAAITHTLYLTIEMRSLQNTGTAVNTIDSSPLQTHLVNICSHTFTEHSSVGIECRYELCTKISLEQMMSQIERLQRK